MAVPYMASTLKGWVKKQTVIIITKTVVNHQTVESENETTLWINKQPVPKWKVDRKPEFQRTWKWWSFIIRNGQLLKTDDIIVINNIRYRIDSGSNWTESGFQKYEAVEDYQ